LIGSRYFKNSKTWVLELLTVNVSLLSFSVFNELEVDGKFNSLLLGLSAGLISASIPIPVVVYLGPKYFSINTKMFILVFVNVIYKKNHIIVIMTIFFTVLPCIFRVRKINYSLLIF